MLSSNFRIGNVFINLPQCIATTKIENIINDDDDNDEGG
jgi:hypothetical protein